MSLVVECSDVSRERTASIFKVMKSVSGGCRSSLDYRNVSVVWQVCLLSPVPVLAPKIAVTKTLNPPTVSVKALSYLRHLHVRSSIIQNLVYLSYIDGYQPSASRGCETVSEMLTRVYSASQIVVKIYNE